MLTNIIKKTSDFNTRYPHWPLIAIALLAWAYYAIEATLLSNSSHAQHHTHHSSPTLITSLTSWMLMVCAMMLPMLSKTARFIHSVTPQYRQNRALLLCVIGYSFIWASLLLTVEGISLITKLLSIDTNINKSVLASFAFLIVGIINQTSYRKNAVFACGSARTPRINGWKADLDTFKIGLQEGSNCFRSCAHIMLAMLTTSHSIWQMAIITLVLIYERAQLPRKTNYLTILCYLFSTAYLVLYVSQRLQAI
ncbi:DUF2182 domain-containing protein [Oceanospirillum beijerinckii]|uniref:copper chaperone n=1 Tax=Oceanospirillum beijerinckii TaxID=64976 RepID=UPI0004028F34|nr:DUF2182 domain-containing protein [Oceanospirillum beijerinckii]